VPGGEYTVLVRGKGTDPVTNVPNTFIATGCTPVTIGAGETVEIRVTLIPIIGMGECGDGTFSPDEQCEDGNTTAGDGCSASCRTEPFVISTAAGMQNNPALAGASGRRWASTYDSETTNVAIRLLDPSGGTITFPGALATDALVPTATPGLYLVSGVAIASDGRIGVSFNSFPEVQVALFDADRTPQGAPIVLRAAGNAKRSRPAFAGNGALLVAFEDDMSGTGISGSVFAAGSTTAGALFDIGASGAIEPSVAGASDHFVVAFSAGGDVFVQRFGSDGAPRDAAPVAVLEDAAGTQDQPAVAALPDGRALVAWRDSGGDGAGTAIRARAFAADGMPAGAAITLNTTTAGDQSAPAVAGAGDRFFVAFQSGASVRARVLSSQGDPIPNREQPPTTADFELAASGAQPAVATGGTDGMRAMAAWSEGGDIRGRLFPLAP
jgi:cysteine-rich repeat protein